MGKEFKANEKRLVPQPPSKSGSMRMFDLDNPDIDLFNMIDDELIRMSGSELYIYKFEVNVLHMVLIQHHQMLLTKINRLFSNQIH